MWFQQVDLYACWGSHFPKINKKVEKRFNHDRWAIMVPRPHLLSADFHWAGAWKPLCCDQNESRLKTDYIQWQPSWHWILCWLNHMAGQPNVPNTRSLTAHFQNTTCICMELSSVSGTESRWANQLLRLRTTRDWRSGPDTLWNPSFPAHGAKIAAESPDLAHCLLPHPRKPERPLPAYPTQPSRNHEVVLPVSFLLLPVSLFATQIVFSFFPGTLSGHNRILALGSLHNKMQIWSTLISLPIPPCNPILLPGTLSPCLLPNSLPWMPSNLTTLSLCITVWVLWPWIQRKQCKAIPCLFSCQYTLCPYSSPIQLNLVSFIFQQSKPINTWVYSGICPCNTSFIDNFW